MSPRRWSPAVPPGTTPRHAQGARPRARWVRTALRGGGSAVAAAVCAVGLACGVVTAAAVQALDQAAAPTVALDGAATAGAAAGTGAGTAAGTGPWTAPGLDAGSGRGAALARPTGGVTASRPLPATAGRVAPWDAVVGGTVARDAFGGRAEDVDAAADLVERVEAAVQGVWGDVRPLPLPALVPRDTVGPVWLSEVDRADGLLSLDVPESGTGVLDVVPGSVPAPGSAPIRTVRVEVERGLPADGAGFAATVMTILNDPRGWGARGEVTFARTDGPADLRVVLVSPATVDAMCAPLRTEGQVSCGRNGHAVLNFRRWVLATDEFADRHLYREYLVNHEVGHLLGHSHEDCPGAGQRAPIMQQQSYAVAPCTANGWPYP